MKQLVQVVGIIALSTIMATVGMKVGQVNADSHVQGKRVGMVVGIHEEMIPEYKRLHADDYAGVRDLLSKYNMENFSIFLHKIDGKWYEFGYYEYTGEDFKADMAALDAEPRNKEWVKVCDPMQAPLKGNTGWAVMEQVYYNP